MSKKYKCSICEETIEGYGNNPWPFAGDKCCDDCNSNVVIPMRLFLSGNMKNHILTIDSSGEMKLLHQEKEAPLELLQELVMGYIELYPLRDNKFYYIVNEEGLLKGMTYNLRAKEVLGIDVVGTVVVVPKQLFK